MEGRPRLLFIPASGPKGSGEYYRSLNIASTLKRKIKGCDIRFILNRNSPFLESCPFPCFDISDIPTRSLSRVNSIIEDLKPNLVIFDATGRSSQVKTAKKCGAITVFIAQNKLILNRAFGLKRLNVTDEVWIVQPEYMLKPGLWNDLKLKLFPVACHQIGPVYPRLTPDQAEKIRLDKHLPSVPYVLLNPGGGGHMLKRKPAAEIFEACAEQLAEDWKVVLVYGPNYTGEPLVKDGIRVIRRMDPESFQAAIMGAAGFISGGGGALFQAVDAGIPTVGVPLSPDQSFRINQMKKRNLIGRAKPDSVEMTKEIMKVMNDPPAALAASREEIHALDRVEKRVSELLNLKS